LMGTGGSSGLFLYSGAAISTRYFLKAAAEASVTVGFAALGLLKVTAGPETTLQV